MTKSFKISTARAVMKNYYGINLYFTEDFFEFPKFINQKEYKEIIFNEPCPYFRKVVIKLRNDNSILYMNQNACPSLISPSYIDNLHYWYITMMGNEITFYSNGRYLGVDLKKGMLISDQFMQRFIYSKVDENNDEFVFYYENKVLYLHIYLNMDILFQKYLMFFCNFQYL